MVAYLSKSDASEGFHQTRFLKWKLYQVNDVTRLQALVDKNKVVVTEATIRDVLHLDDEEGVDCLPNEEIFAELARMGYEKPSTKLTFYKAFFSSDLSTHTTKYTSPALTQKVFANMRRVGKGFSGVETPLFEGMLVEQQVDKEGDADENVKEVNVGVAAEGDDSVAHGEVPTIAADSSIISYTTYSTTTTTSRYPFNFPSITNTTTITSVIDACAAFTRRVEHLQFYKVAQALEITKLKRRVKKLERRNKGRMIAKMDQDDVVVLEDDKEEDREVADAIKDVEEAKEDETKPAEVQEVADVVTTAKLITEVVTAASETITAAIDVDPSRRRKGVVIRDPKEESTTSTIIPAETKSKDKGKGILVEEPKPLKKKQHIEQDEQHARELHAELNKDIDWDEAIDHVKRKAKEDPAVKRYQVLKRKPQTEAQARKNMMMYLKNVAGFKIDYFKGMSYDDIRPIFEAKFNLNVAFLLKTKEQIEEDENKALQKINETPAERAAKRRKLDEEVKELKRHLQIVPNEDDDVYREATPFARKVPVVDYQIIEMNNKPYYKIIRADDTDQLYISFLTLLRNFDREDLKALWSLVKERFSTTNSKNFSDDFLLVTLGAMFEKPDIHAQIWKNQRTVHGPAKVKGWKLLESCGVQIITFTSTQLILLVERNKIYIVLNKHTMKVEESLNVTFDESPPPPKTSPLEDDDLVEEQAIKKFGLQDSKPMKMPISSDTKLTKDQEGESVENTKYRGMIGSLLYLMASRPNIIFIVCLYARFQDNPKTSHLEAVKRIFRYIKGTRHLGLWYPKGSGIETVVYADSDNARDYVDRKSTSSICTFMRCCLTSWFSKKKIALAISTTEAEYVSAEKACQQSLWMKQALIEYEIRLDNIPIMCDYKGAIDLSKNPVQHSRTKHIEIYNHFLRDNIQKGNISIEIVPSEDNIANILTEPLKCEPLILCV
nr:hypothetical protein [Tanacetum cinerariifolium]